MTISSAWRAGSISKNKTLIAQKPDRPDVAQKRIQWCASQAQINPAKVAFIDETWAKTNMIRRYGRSLRYTQLMEETACGRWQTTTFLGARRAEGFIAPMIVEGPTNGSLFHA